MAANDGKEIISSSLIIGASSVFTAASGIIKMKAVALLLGPIGIGLIGLFQNLMAVVTQVSSVGVNNSGTREVAQSLSLFDENEQRLTRVTLIWLGVILSILGGLGVLAFGTLYILTFNESSIGFSGLLWLATGVFFGVIAAPPGALLAGVRDIKAIAAVRILSSLFSAIIGVAVIFFAREKGVFAFVVIAPFLNFIFVWVFAKKVKLGLEGVVAPGRVIKNFSHILKQGAGFMASGLFMAIGLLVVRFIYKEEIGVEELGFLQASWVISASYLGLVFSSMGTNYFPKLSELVSDKKKLFAFINLQAEIAFLFAAPIIIFMATYSDFIISTLYSKDFGPAADILAFQLIGDVFKLASWPLGFVLLAAGMSRLYMYKGLFIVLIFVASVYWLVPKSGVLAVGFAYALMYSVNFMILIVLLAFNFECFYSVKVWGLFLYSVAAVITLSICSFYDYLLGVYIGSFFFLISAFYSVYRLNSMVGLMDKVKSKLGFRYE